MLRRRRVRESAAEESDAPAGRRWGRRSGAGPTAGERTAGVLAGGGLLLLRIVRLIAAVLIGIIALAIVFILLDASNSNTIVFHIRDWAHTLASPFKGIFHLHSAKNTVALNYGVAIVVYAIVTALLSRLITALFAPAARRAPA